MQNPLRKRRGEKKLVSVQKRSRRVLMHTHRNLQIVFQLHSHCRATPSEPHRCHPFLTSRYPLTSFPRQGLEEAKEQLLSLSLCRRPLIVPPIHWHHTFHHSPLQRPRRCYSNDCSNDPNYTFGYLMKHLWSPNPNPRQWRKSLGRKYYEPPPSWRCFHTQRVAESCAAMSLQSSLRNPFLPFFT
jgi:hypothetical protein